MTPMQARTPAERTAELSSIQDQLAPMLNRKFAQQGVGTEAQAIKAGAFGDRRDVYEGERQAALDAQMYNLSSQELARRDQEAMQRQQMGLQTLGAQLGAGAAARGVDQLGLDRAYEAYLMEQQFPLAQLSALTGGSASFLRELVQRQGRHAIQWVALVSSLLALATLAQGFGFGG